MPNRLVEPLDCSAVPAPTRAPMPLPSIDACTPTTVPFGEPPPDPASSANAPYAPSDVVVCAAAAALTSSEGTSRTSTADGARVPARGPAPRELRRDIWGLQRKRVL